MWWPRKPQPPVMRTLPRLVFFSEAIVQEVGQQLGSVKLFVAGLGKFNLNLSIELFEGGPKAVDDPCCCRGGPCLLHTTWTSFMLLESQLVDDMRCTTANINQPINQPVNRPAWFFLLLNKSFLF